MPTADEPRLSDIVLHNSARTLRCARGTTNYFNRVSVVVQYSHDICSIVHISDVGSKAEGSYRAQQQETPRFIIKHTRLHSNLPIHILLERSTF